MLIILEGPDGSGKTQLARDLEELIQRALPNDTVEVRHSGPPTGHPLDEYERSLTWYRPGEGNHLILDRWHWGEYVYPAVTARPSKYTYIHQWHVENYLRRLGALVVQATQYADQYRRVYAERGETREAAILPQVEHHYRNMRNRTHLPVVDYNWMSPIWGDQHRIVQAAEEAERECIRLNPFVTYVGPPRVDFLLLGDMRHRKQPPTGIEYWDPAFVPFSSTSGDYLLGAVLSGDEFGQNFKFGLANACDIDDAYALWLNLGQPRVVALGRNAKRRIDKSCKIGFEARGVVPHPQYVRRFHHRDQWAYGQNIRMAARHGGDYSKWHSQLREERDRMSMAKSSKTSAGAVSDVSPATV